MKRFFISLLAFWSGLLAAADQNATQAKLHTVKAAPFRIELNLKGVLTPARFSEMKIRPEIWADLTVARDAMAHGSQVTEGDLLVSLKKEKIEQQLMDWELSLEGTALDLAIAQAEYSVATNNAALDQQAAAETLARLEVDVKRYLAKTRELNTRSAMYSQKSAENSLAYAQEELKQLKKMYEADDITEETEEIIVKRAQHSVDRALHFLNRQRHSTETSLEHTLPREEADKQAALTRQRLATDLAQATLEEKLAKLKVELDKKVRAQKLAKTNIAKLRSDLALLTVRSPIAGVLYHGAFVEGVWGGRKSVQTKLRKDGKLTAGETFMTVVAAGELRATATLGEADLRKVAPSQKGWAIPTADPAARVAVTVESVSRIPTAPGQYTVVFKVAVADQSYLHPGMTCAIQLRVLDKPKAVTIPSKALRAAPQGGTMVWVKTQTGHLEREVTPGNSHAGKTEITEGLNEGDEVLLP
mgnify:FL=1